MVHLCGRPMPRRGKCVLGRETGIQKVYWNEEGWLRLASGGNTPKATVPGIDDSETKNNLISQYDDFDTPELDIHFQTLRVPLDEDTCTLREKPGYLTLKGRESLSSHHTQSLVARRQQAFSYEAKTKLDFNPETFQQMAGLICLYDSNNFFYLFVSNDEDRGRSVNIMICDNKDFSFPLSEPVSIGDTGEIGLKVEVSYDQLQFSYSLNQESWIKIGKTMDASILSDDYPETKNQGKFTGAFVGLCCQDLSGRKTPAHFDFFEYIEKE